jgi:hypothetical protein
MCHWVRELDRRRGIVGGELPAKSDFIRPRVVGAVAVALVALIAAAAPLLLPTSTPAVSSEQGAAVTTVAARVNEPAGSIIEQTTTALDDGVPSSEGPHDTVRAGGHCDHGL